ncbi:hypothetical protein ACIQU1_21765 [Streptomyces angustmyceticus]|uniref:hypothetical protein n=1 Tax=Streptomyces angustmyceticus TaxID=285578 RepID=UPI0038107863
MATAVRCLVHVALELALSGDLADRQEQCADFPQPVAAYGRVGELAVRFDASYPVAEHVEFNLRGIDHLGSAAELHG